MSIELQPWRRELTTRSWRPSLEGSLRSRMKRARPPHSRSFILWNDEGYDELGCRFPVSSADFWLCLCKFCGEADRGGLARQWREFKTYRKSTGQLMRERKETA